MTSALAPERLDDANELPATFDDAEPLWSENYCKGAFDPEHGLTAWLHLGRVTGKPGLWHEIVVIGLPSGEHLVAKAHGRGSEEAGASAAMMAFRCEQPWERWRTAFDGVGLIVPPGRLDGAAMEDGVYVPVDIDLGWTAAAPAWDVGAALERQAWGHLHYSQVCRVEGTLRCGGAEHRFSGSGIRDHTRGPRDFRTIDRHVWLYGHFPGSGRTVQVMDAIVRPEAGGHHLAVSAVLSSPERGLEPCTIVESPLLDEDSDTGAPFELGLEAGDRQIQIGGTIARESQIGLADVNEMVVGHPPGLSHPVFEGFTEFEW